MDKIFIYTNDFLISKRLQEIEENARIFNDFMHHCKDTGITSEQAKTILESQFNKEVIQGICQSLYKKENKFIRAIMQTETQNHLLNFNGKNHSFSSSYIEIKNGTAQIEPTAHEQLKEQYGVYLSTPQGIERYNTHKELTDNINKLIKELDIEYYKAFEELFIINSQTRQIELNPHAHGYTN